MKNLTIVLILLASFSTISAQKSKFGQQNIQTKSEKTPNKEILPHFIQFGIMSRNHLEFKKKYNVEVMYENCVITKYMSEKAKENNKLVAKILTEKYGDSWKQDLGFIPHGL
ncbi:hypothetical protein AR438_05465 [Chryseobacterium aquaticum]|uniref:Uncharacterized protein n=1 Tax=Chryseobacterium aquaticum TaxID=452084 RepID=A0A0Q3KQZ0_9FLAO|nr:hypothetical protein [Chryseobacterium aquaticum]KQK26692.1 hypothetical protein AR438_05465 [Chryseobacterium aquaticum]